MLLVKLQLAVSVANSRKIVVSFNKLGNKYVFEILLTKCTTKTLWDTLQVECMWNSYYLLCKYSIVSFNNVNIKFILIPLKQFDKILTKYKLKLRSRYINARELYIYVFSFRQNKYFWITLIALYIKHKKGVMQFVLISMKFN